MASKLRFKGGRWRDALGRFVSAGRVAPVVKAPPRTVRVEEREPHRYVRVTVNVRYVIPGKTTKRGKSPDRMVEAHKSVVLRNPSRTRERETAARLRKELRGKVHRETGRAKLGKAAGKLSGVEYERSRRRGRGTESFEVRETRAKGAPSASRGYK